MDRVLHALSCISNFKINEHELQIISESLNTVFDQDFVNSELIQNLKMEIPFEVPKKEEAKLEDLFKIAKNYGWTLDAYFHFRNEDLERYEKLIPPTAATVILDNRFLNEYQDWEKIGSKTQIIHSSHGTGKTEWVLNELRNKTFLYVTHREELARDFSIRATNAGIPNVLYKDLDINAYRLISSSIVDLYRFPLESQSWKFQRSYSYHRRIRSICFSSAWWYLQRKPHHNLLKSQRISQKLKEELLSLC